MTAYFKHQMIDYVEYHRDPRNCMMHVVGINLLFFAAILPPTTYSISLFGWQTSLATLLVLPVLLYWLLLDMALGLAIVAAAGLLLLSAAIFVNHASVVGIWITTAVLLVAGVASQIIGHRVFERRQPALIDNPTHLLLGPMFVMAKLFIALGFKQDLVPIIGPAIQRGSVTPPVHRDHRSEPHTPS